LWSLAGNGVFCAFPKSAFMAVVNFLVQFFERQ
jgi:hypothetical protein